MIGLGEVTTYERRLRAALFSLNKRNIVKITLVEAIDEASLWSEPFEKLVPIAPKLNFDILLARAPLFVCAVAAEIGFRFEGVGTEYWAKLSDALGLPISMAQRTQIGNTFVALAAKYKLSQPAESAFSSHFSIISWPIANALLPIDLVGPVGRLMARAPYGALPGPRRSANFASLRAWASAAEGARLADWLRLKARLSAPSLHCSPTIAPGSYRLRATSAYEQRSRPPPKLSSRSALVDSGYAPLSRLRPSSTVLVVSPLRAMPWA